MCRVASKNGMALYECRAPVVKSLNYIQTEITAFFKSQMSDIMSNKKIDSNRVRCLFSL